MITHRPHCRTPPPAPPYRGENHKELGYSRCPTAGGYDGTYLSIIFKYIEREDPSLIATIRDS